MSSNFVSKAYLRCQVFANLLVRAIVADEGGERPEFDNSRIPDRLEILNTQAFEHHLINPLSTSR